MGNDTPNSTPVQLSFDDLEEWRDIPGYESIYAVSNLGRVKRLAGSKLGRGYILKEDRLLKPGADTGGYLSVKLGLRGVFSIILVHRLVMLAFVGPRLDMDVNHINSIRDDNRLENLEYLTHFDNMQHSAGLGRMKAPRGELSPASKLTDKDIPEIRRLLAQGDSYRSIGRAFNVSYNTIRQIDLGYTWKHIK